MRVSFIVISLCSTLSVGCEIGLAGFDCSVTDDRQATVGTSGATEVRVIARAGSLEIRGRPDLDEVRVSGTACADTSAHLDQVELLTRRDGDAIVVESMTEHGRLDLVLEVPDTLPLVVRDGSGSVAISGIEALDLEDSSGSVRIESVGGDVSIRDGSGSLDIERVEGSVTIESDGAGSMKIDAVAGDVLVEDDGSGSIVITEVAGDAVIMNDGSGSITVTHVRGDFSVSRDGSGRIRSSHIDGRVSIP